MPKSLGYETTATGGAVTDGMAATNTTTGGTVVGGTQTYAADAKFEGSFGRKIVTTSAAISIERQALTDTTQHSLAWCAVMSLDALPTSTFTTLMSLRYSSGPALRVIQNAAGMFGVRGQGTTTPQNIGTVARATAKQYLITGVATTDTTTATNGKYSVKIYDASVKTLLDTFTQTGVALDLTVNPFAAADLGFANSDPQVGRTVRFDSVKLVEGGTTEVFPDSWNAAAHLAGQVWDGTALQNVTVQQFDGSLLQDFGSLTFSS